MMCNPWEWRPFFGLYVMDVREHVCDDCGVNLHCHGNALLCDWPLAPEKWYRMDWKDYPDELWVKFVKISSPREYGTPITVI